MVSALPKPKRSSETQLRLPSILADPERFLQVNNLGASSVDFLMRVWCNADTYFKYQAAIKLKVKEALDAADINIPFATRTVVAQSPDQSDFSSAIATE